MRSLAVFIAIFSALPISLVYPFVGLLLWAWVAFMSPHREAYGLAYDYPFNYYIAATTLVAWLLSTEPKSIPNQMLPVLFTAFAVMITISTYFAIDHAAASLLWEMHIKTIALLLMTMVLVTSKLRIQAFLWVLALSIGYFGVKGGGFVLVTGAVNARIFGSAGSMITDNNNLALALVITLPIMQYLRTTSTHAAVKAATVIATLLTLIAIVGTYSRGGFIGLVVIGFAFFLMARRKLPALILTGVLGLAILNYAPAAWFERIDTIWSYKTEGSSVGRLNAWRTSWNLANDRPLVGGGFAAIETPRTYVHYRGPGDETEGRAAHNIFFQVLGDHGFVGLFLYLSILGAGLYNLILVLRQTKDRPDLGWANLLSRMLLVSFAGYVTAGSFLSMAYYDGFLCMVALSAAMRAVVKKELAIEPEVKEEVADTGPLVPAWRAIGASGRSATPTR